MCHAACADFNAGGKHAGWLHAVLVEGPCLCRGQRRAGICACASVRESCMGVGVMGRVCTQRKLWGKVLDCADEGGMPASSHTGPHHSIAPSIWLNIGRLSNITVNLVAPPHVAD